MLSSQVKTTRYSLATVWVLAAKASVHIEEADRTVQVSFFKCPGCCEKILASMTWPPTSR